MKTKKKELKELMQMKDTDIDYTDIPEIQTFRGWQPNPYYKRICCKHSDNKNTQK